MSTANTTKPQTPKDGTPAPKKSKAGVIAATTVGVAAVGIGAFFLTRDANAAEPDTKAGGKGKGSGKGKGKKQGGSKGPKVDPRGNKKPGKADRDETPSAPPKPEDGREGHFWGDPSKIPDDFDYGSNKIYVAADCSSVAVGYWFLAQGTKDGEFSEVPLQELVESIGDDSDPTVRIPRDDFNGVGPAADLIGILAEHPKRTAYTWVGEYYGKIASMPGHSSTQLAEDLLRQASERTGGRDCVADRANWSPAMWDFLSWLASNLDDFRLAAYGPKPFEG